MDRLTFPSARDTSSTAKYRYEIQVDDARGADNPSNVRSQWAKRGWILCGHVEKDMQTTLVLKRPLPQAHATPDDDGPANALGEPMSSIPEALHFVTEQGARFDVDELVDHIEQKGVFTDYWNGKLSDADVERLILHPSNAGLPLAAMRSRDAAGRLAITVETAERLVAIAAVLDSEQASGELSESTAAIAAFARYAEARATSERIALQGARFELVDQRGAVFAVSVMEALTAVQTHVGCHWGTARYLRQIAARICQA